MTPHEKLRARYFEQFGVPAPFTKPIDEAYVNGLIRGALKNNTPLPQWEEGDMT